MKRNERGLNLIELQIVIAILILLWVIAGVSAFTRFGIHLKSIAMVASPVAFLVASLLVMGVGDFVRERRASRRIERLLALLEGGDSESARRELLVLEETPVLRHALQARRPRVVAAIAGPWPGREIAYRLHLRLLDRYRDSLAGPLQESLALWPQDLFAPVLADIARREDAREATRVLLDRTPQEDRGTLLGRLFGLIDPVAPQSPTPEWLDLLRPYRGPLEELLRRPGYRSVPAEHLRRYLKEMG